MNKSIQRAGEIIEQHFQNISILGDHLLSIILVGSLSNNSYTGDTGSDIDLIHILKDEANQKVRNQVLEIICMTQNQTNNDLQISKCIYYYSDLFHPYKTDFEFNLSNKDYIELPIEILRIKDSGITVYGKNIIKDIDSPTREDIIQFQYLSKEWSETLDKIYPEHKARRKEVLKNPSTRMVVQIVLTGAMLDYYFATNKSCSSKRDIAERMKQEVSDYQFQDLLDLASKWRHSKHTFTARDQEKMVLLFKEWSSNREKEK